MGENEQKIIDALVDELDAGEAPAAQPGMSMLHGGPGTTESLNYSPGSSTSRGDVAGLHEAAGSRPLAGDFVAPTGGADGADGADAEQERDAAFAALTAQLRIDRAAADASFRAFCKSPVISTGYVVGLELLQRLQDQERTKR